MRILTHFSAEGLSNVYLIVDEKRNVTKDILIPTLSLDTSFPHKNVILN